MNIYQKLSAIQLELVCPKNQRNDFGKYNYRSCEDILSALKPVAAAHGAVVAVGDELVMIGERYYIKATARIIDLESESPSEITNSAFAREESDKKGMDGSQITGAASSYARKYALNGMFGIDDVKDADTNEFTERMMGKSTQKKACAKDPPEAVEAMRQIIYKLAGGDISRVVSFADVLIEKNYPDSGLTFETLNLKQLAQVKVAIANAIRKQKEKDEAERVGAEASA